MWPTSDRFADALTGSHEVVTRVRAFATGLFFAADPTSDLNPRFGVVPFDTGASPRLPVISGDVKLTRTGEIRGTAALTTAGEGMWDLLQPWGVTLFIERGIDFGDGTQEFVPLGYYRINEVDQPSAPHGPLDLDCADRSAQVLQNRAVTVYQIPEAMTHRTVFSWLVNGDAGAGQSTAGYGAYYYRAIPITWDAGTYDPDVVTVTGKPVIEDGDVWKFLRELADQQGCALRFDEAGELRIEPLVPVSLDPVFAVRAGPGGNLVRASRSVSRDGIYNFAVAYGTDPAAAVGRYYSAYDVVNSPQRWARSHFGVVPRFFGSPLIRTGAAAQAAADTLAERTARLPLELSLDIVPNPALRPNDVISVDLNDGEAAELRIVDEVSIPLAGSSPMSVTTLPLESA